MSVLALEKLTLPAPEAGFGLADLDLTVAAGEQIALLGEGPGGAALLAPLLKSGGLHKSVSGQLRMGDGGAMLLPRAPMPIPPRLTVAQAIAHAARRDHRARLKSGVDEVLRECADLLPSRFGARRVGDLTPGERLLLPVLTAAAIGPALIFAEGPLMGADPVGEANYWSWLRWLCRQKGIALVLVTAEPALAAEIADRVAVFHAGRLVEDGPLAMVFERPRHPYTRALIAAPPERKRSLRKAELLPGLLPGTGLTAGRAEDASGCPFHPRCPNALAGCYLDLPGLTEEDERRYACHWPLNTGER